MTAVIGRNSRRVRLFVALMIGLGAAGAARAEGPAGFGVLGDSYSDEYRFYPPDRATARNWIEILATARGIDFGPFSDASRGEPRNQGFAYNWARSEATTDDMIAAGQLDGLAAQVARGEVGTVCIFIGGNDFIGAFRAADPVAAVDATLPRALANFRKAVETILAADPRVRLVVATVPDIRHLPDIAAAIRAGRVPSTLPGRITAAMAVYNAQVRSVAADNPRIALVDLDLTTRVADRISRDSVVVAGRKLDRIHASNAPDCFFLADGRHPGTLGQGLMADMILQAMNARFGAGLRPLGRDEILGVAGIPPLLASSGLGSRGPHGPGRAAPAGR